MEGGTGYTVQSDHHINVNQFFRRAVVLGSTLNSNCSQAPHKEDPGGRKDLHLNCALDQDDIEERLETLENTEETTSH